MAVNDKVSQAEYNNIRNKLIPVIGGGYGNTGWGQPIVSSSVQEGKTVSINEWANLGYDITNAWKHISGSNPDIASVIEGGKIRYSANFAPGSSSTPVNQYDQWADAIVANKYALSTSSAITVNKGSKTFSGTWNGTLGCRISVSFPSPPSARYFFNSGGQIRFTSSRTDGSSSTQNNAWTSLLNSAGTQPFGAVLPNAGTSPPDGTNYYRCVDGFGRWYTTSSSTPYSLNSYNIYARTPGIGNNSVGDAQNLEFVVTWVDDHTGIAGGFDQVDGFLNIAVSTLEASQVLVPVSAGTFSVASPTVYIGNIGYGW